MKRRITRKPLTAERRAVSPISALCSEEGCGRHAYSAGLCQTHHRQSMTTGKLTPIRPYHRRKGKTVRFSGIRMAEEAAAYLADLAERQGVSQSAALAEVAEAWVRRGYKLDD